MCSCRKHRLDMVDGNGRGATRLQSPTPALFLPPHFHNMSTKRARDATDDVRNTKKPRVLKTTTCSDQPVPTSATVAPSPSPQDRAANGQPLNTELPLNFTIPKKGPGNVRIAAWNVAGLNACLKKGFRIYAPREDADVWILTETKVRAFGTLCSTRGRAVA